MDLFPKQYPVSCHTDHIGQGSTFVAIKGLAQNGVSFITLAIEKGATRVVVEQTDCLAQDVLELANKNNVTIQRVQNSRKALAQLSAHAVDFPAEKLKIIGITGTNGKTTTAYLIEHMLKEAGYKTALLSSVSNIIGDYVLNASLTTEQPDYLHQFLKQCVENDVEWVVMEVAAQAISLHRIDGIAFDVVIITNIAREHLEFYHSMIDYIQAKKKLLSFRKKGAPAWLNSDDEKLKLVDEKNVHWFGLRHRDAHMRGALKKNEQHALLGVITHDGKEYAVSCPVLCGEYNLYNVLSAVSGALDAGVAWSAIQKALATFRGVPGRLERYALSNGATALIDHAHNPLSFQVLLSMLRTHTEHLLVVFGAGGERDEGRRPEMGRIAAQYADCVIITADNPRSENPMHIAEDICRGIGKEEQYKITIELDRERAIHTAYSMADSGSIIALLGKGSEEYQVVGRSKVPFSERTILLSI